MAPARSRFGHKHQGVLPPCAPFDQLGMGDLKRTRVQLTRPLALNLGTLLCTPIALGIPDTPQCWRRQLADRLGPGGLSHRQETHEQSQDGSDGAAGVVLLAHASSAHRRRGSKSIPVMKRLPAWALIWTTTSMVSISNRLISGKASPAPSGEALTIKAI